jgi:hypothetical protein
MRPSRRRADVLRDAVQDVVRDPVPARAPRLVHHRLAAADACRLVGIADVRDAREVSLAGLPEQILPALRQAAAPRPRGIVVQHRRTADGDAELFAQPAHDRRQRVIGGEPFHHIDLVLLGQLAT